MKYRYLYLIMILASVLSVHANSAVPTLINYQGLLTGSTGNALDTTANVIFAIYNVPTGGVPIWAETQSVTSVDGLFTVLLGTNTPIDATIIDGVNRYLETQLGASPFTLRTRLAASPYAIRIATVDGASGGTVSGNLSVTGKATIGDLHSNTGTFAFAAGWRNNVSGQYSSVGGGYDNTASNDVTTVGGGYFNTASGSYATVGGGYLNTSSNNYTTVGGGANNIASGNYSTVPGGFVSAARGTSSFAAGSAAKANHNGAVVIAANSNPSSIDSVSSSANEQIVLRADGYFYLTNAAGAASIPAGRFLNTSAGGYLTTGGAWTNASDKNSKENFSNVDGQELLEKIAELDVSQWNYKVESDDVKHIGPVAQDFYEQFGLGQDNKSISTVDASGVALAAIKALYQENQELKKRLEKLESLLSK